MKKKIADLLTEKVDEVFLEFQKELEIDNGDIEPLEVFELDSLIYELAAHIEKVLKNQKGGF